MRATTYLRTLLIVGLHAAVVVVVLELCARTDDSLRYGANFWDDYREEMLFVTDSLGYHLRPSSRYQKWQIDSLGFRGPEVTMEKPSGVIRIVTVGASETFGLYESPNKEFPRQLQSILDSVQPGRFQVLNAGIPGISPSRIGFYVEHWIERFNPNVVIYYPTPSFVLDPQPATTRPSVWKPKAQQQGGYRFSLRLAGRLRDLYKKLAPEAIQMYVRQKLIEREIASHPQGWILDHIPPASLSAFADQLRVLAASVQGTGSTLMFATHACRLDSVRTDDDRQVMAAWRKQSPRTTESCLIESEVQINSILSDVSRELGIRLIDVDAAVPPSSKYFADYYHFTDVGAELVAHAMASEIITWDSEASGSSAKPAGSATE